MSRRGRTLLGLVLMGTMTSGCWVLEPGVAIDPGYYPPDEGSSDAGACASRLSPSGIVQAGGVPIDYSGGRVTVTAVHKVDVDAVEDRCVARLEFTVSLARGECPLRLVFTGRNGVQGGLTEARLTADSACPGFLDAVEGVYGTPEGFAPWLHLGPREVPERMAERVCMRSVRLGFPAYPLRLYRASPSPAELTVNLGGLELHGELLSTGDPEAKCFEASACGPGLHDGGDGWCVEAGSCSPGYRLSLEGSCTP
ncbi:hypothetical protein [Archangium lipolyticum]|uniref:hypothetical protein n=1 Tax=Archangium lipolyticum TaxID=2970465 RepID=UPI00214A3520|nr:hypothetical protein [Archangium lipolyticum]